MRNMNCVPNSLAFLIFVVVILIVGATTGAYHAYFRQVKCLEYTPCPSVAQTYPAYGDNDRCIKIQDPMGLESIGSIMITIHESVPGICWTDGFNVSFNDPYSVMIYSWIAICALIVIYAFFATIAYCKYPSLRQYIAHDDHRTTICTSPCTWTVRTTLFSEGVVSTIFFLAVGVYFTAMVITAGDYNLLYVTEEATCTNYVVTMEPLSTNSSMLIPTFVQFAAYVTNNGSIGINNLTSNTWQPTFLPSSCWINHGSVTFYDQNTIYAFLTIIFFSIETICLLFYFLQKRCNRPHYNLPAPYIPPQPLPTLKIHLDIPNDPISNENVGQTPTQNMAPIISIH